MHWEESWSNFIKTGNISDYLEYSNSYKAKDALLSGQRNEENADKDKWDSDKVKKHW